MTPTEVKTERSLALSDKTIDDLQNLLSRNINTEDDLLRAARNLATLNINGSNRMTLDGYLLNRLHSRCPSNVDFGTWLRETIKTLLAGYAGC